MQTLKDGEKKKTSVSENSNKKPSDKKKKNKIDSILSKFKLEKIFKDTDEKNIYQDFWTTEEKNSEFENSFLKNKKTEIIKKDMKGKTVFLEDTGEKLGTVYDSIYDENKKLIGYKIKDDSSDAILSFPLKHFEVDKKGLIFTPQWYTKALKTVEKLEFKDRVSPELTALLTDDEEYNKELYQVFIKHDSEMTDFIDETLSLKKMLNSHLKVLQRKREDIKENLMDLTERRLIKDIDRREFAEDVMEHRRKVNILEINISKCKKLLKRLDSTSFGVLGKTIITEDDSFNLDNYKKNLDSEKNFENNELDYREKYLVLKEKFENLEDQYDELKNSVEKLLK